MKEQLLSQGLHHCLDPVAVAMAYGDMEPSPGQATFMRAICSKDPKYRQVVAKVHRKGGKTKSVATSFACLFKQDPKLRIFHLSGSYLQASRLYDYFKPLATNQELFPDALAGEPTKYLTRFKEGGCLEVLTASAKSIRGGDADILSVDEAVLVPQTLINAAWPLIRASKFPKRIVTSTASPEVNLEWFIRLWQNAADLKFERFEWPQSECPWIRQEDSALAKLMLDSQTYSVEYEGAIGERTGRVWDSILIEKACVDPHNSDEYPLANRDGLTEWSVGLDWGFIHPTVSTVWERQGETLYARDCRIRAETALTEIMQELRQDFPSYTIYADSSGAHENDQLKRLGMKVEPVIFSKQKDELIGHVRWRLEKGLIKIPDPRIDSRFSTLVQQMKAYNYDPHGKPRKANDDCVDSMLCAMKPFLPPQLTSKLGFIPIDW